MYLKNWFKFNYLGAFLNHKKFTNKFNFILDFHKSLWLNMEKTGAKKLVKGGGANVRWICNRGFKRTKRF